MPTVGWIWDKDNDAFFEATSMSLLQAASRLLGFIARFVLRILRNLHPCACIWKKRMSAIGHL